MVEVPMVEPPRLRTVVLRPGPPVARGPRKDAAIGVAGLLLLGASVALVFVLAPTDPVVPQFQVDVTQVQVNLTSQRLILEEGTSIEVPFDVEHDNVFFILLDVGFTEDRPASLPDTFEVALFDAEGDLVGDRAEVTNTMGQASETSLGLEWEPVHKEARLSFDLLLPPESDFVSGRPGQAADDVAAEFLEENHRPTAGTWTVRVTLQSAGDCPQPGPDTDPLHIAVCRGPGDGVDAGNPFSVELFQYTYFEPHVIRL